MLDRLAYMWPFKDYSWAQNRRAKIADRHAWEPVSYRRPVPPRPRKKIRGIPFDKPMTLVKDDGKWKYWALEPPWELDEPELLDKYEESRW